jgi:aryl-alcohol dehydrogenase-like predicted oxidoreductase
LGLIPWSPLSGGLLGGAIGRNKTGRRSDTDVEKDVKKFTAQLSQYEKFCKQK